MFADLLLDFEVHKVQYMYIDTFSAAAPPFTIFALIVSLCAYVIETFFKMMLLWWCFCVRVGNNNTLNLNYIYNRGRCLALFR